MQTVSEKKIEVRDQIDKYLKKNKRSRKFLKSAAKTSSLDVFSKLEVFYETPTSKNFLNLMKSLANSGTWIGHSYVRFLISLIDFKVDISANYSELDEYILERVSKGLEISYKKATYSEIFKAIYNDLELSHNNETYKSRLTCPSIKPTLVLISGVFNEIFSTPAFERGAKHLSSLHGINYITPKVSGTSSTSENIDSIKEQLFKYIEDNPDEKLWLLTFSKGGIDTLHFLHNNVEFAEKYVTGISSIASPILGSEHENHRLIKLVTYFHKFSENKVYRYFDKKIDLLFKEFQKSLSADFQKNWFQKNHQELPKGIFYTALALESEWYESHLWMILTKLFFQSDTINDGVVNADQALYPDYFKGLNLGIIRGHHLIGTRSSYYSQEALLEAHIIFLNYLKLLN